jgi:hypothetical protein
MCDHRTTDSAQQHWARVIDEQLGPLPGSCSFTFLILQFGGGLRLSLSYPWPPGGGISGIHEDELLNGRMSYDMTFGCGAQERRSNKEAAMEPRPLRS